MQLSAFSFCNFIGPLGAGAVSEPFVRLKTLPRTIWMTSTQVIMIIAFLLHASALDSTLSTATALLGMCYGVQYSIMIVLFQQNFYDASDFSDRLVLKVCVCRRLRKFAKIIGLWYIDDSVYKRSKPL
ncbi:protein NUCLEAR FUSION DEFECTIVE [Trifolium repens]|nr:protein NUCLEAR FUSION DEFECTIVE [Trifolium repens]